jgi:hypothetical protein
MTVAGFDTFLWVASVIGEVALLGVLLERRRYKQFPVFVSWVGFNVLSEPLIYFLIHHVSAATYFKAYFALAFPQNLIELGVLVEIAANVLRPVKRSIPSGSLPFLFIVMLGFGVGGFLLAAHLNESTLTHPRAFVVVNTTVAILRLLTFIVIAGFSQVLGLGWKNHVLQLASGLAFYSAVTLIVELAHSHLRAGPNYASDYYMLAHFRVLGYLCALYYWCFCFARQEAPRKEFNSKMSDFLVSMSGMAKQQQSVVARKHR